MTVIRRKQQSCANPNSTNVSDTESLHLPSEPTTDTESLNSEPILPARRPPPPATFLRFSQIEELAKLKKSSGRKKLRRFENKIVLQTLSEEDEIEAGAFLIMEPYKSPFCRLLEDEKALEFWNDFIEKSEEEQHDIVHAFSKNYIVTAKKEKPASTRNNRISNKIRRTFKIRKNLSLDFVKTSEDDLIEFFKLTPKDVYVKSPPSSFGRLLLHAIARYHGLQSINVMAENEKRSVNIFNDRNDWIQAECFLTDFIAQLRR